MVLSDSDEQVVLASAPSIVADTNEYLVTTDPTNCPVTKFKIHEVVGSDGTTPVADYANFLSLDSATGIVTAQNYTTLAPSSM